MKGFKNQLIVAVAMLLVTAIALGTATYAWFVDNATVEVSTITLTASAARNLEIALNDTDTTTPGTAGTNDATTLNGLVYGSKVTPTPYAADFVPASLANSNISLFSETFFTDTSWSAAQADGLIYAEKFATNNDTVADGLIDTEIKALALSFRASENMNVYLNATTLGDVVKVPTTLTAKMETELDALVGATGVADDTKHTVADRYEIGSQATVTAALAAQLDRIQKAIRVAFVVDGVTTPIILEADAANHTWARDTTTNSTIAADGTAIKSVQADTTITADDVETQARELFNAYLLGNTATFETSGTANIFVTDPGTCDHDNKAGTPEVDVKPLFNLVANTPKAVTLIVWLDGVDNDCVTAISNDSFALDFSFIGGEQD